MALKNKGSPLTPASLHLLVPPVRLMSAFIWQIVQQHSVMQYDKLVDFISLATEMVPELLSPGKRAQLILNLRARPRVWEQLLEKQPQCLYIQLFTHGHPPVPHFTLLQLVLELCRGDGAGNLQTIQNHLDKIHAFSAELSSTDHMANVELLKSFYTNFSSLIQNLLNVPFEKELFFQEFFRANYGSSYDQRLEQQVFEFLSRLEQLLVIPDLQQTAAWLSDTRAVSKEFGQHLSESFTLKNLLRHHRQLGTLSSAPPSSEEDILLSTLVPPALTGVYRFPERCSKDNHDNEEEILTLEDLEEDSSQSSDVTADYWLPKRDSGGLSCLFVCPQCPFTRRTKRTVQEHIQSEHRITAHTEKKTPVKKDRAKASQKREDAEQKKGISTSEKKRKRKQKNCFERKRERKQKRDNLENKERSRGEDKRFLTVRAATKNLTESETKCSKCEKSFEHPNQLRTHLKLYSFPYCCAQCEKGFTSPSGYYQHQRLHKRGRMFVCSQCDKGFLCSYSLRQHERLHNGPAHLCTICGKGFSKAGFVRHMQMHRGEKNYLCTTCGKSFLSSGELVLHTRSHTGETPYTCGSCGKGFSSKSHLNVHTRSHTGERPYACAECPKRFLTLNCLKRHVLSHNGVKPFKCPNCEKEFSQQGNMKRHWATHKPDA